MCWKILKYLSKLCEISLCDVLWNLKEEKKYLINNGKCRNRNKYKGGAKIGQICLNWLHRHVHCFNNKKLDTCSFIWPLCVWDIVAYYARVCWQCDVRGCGQHVQCPCDSWGCIFSHACHLCPEQWAQMKDLNLQKDLFFFVLWGNYNVTASLYFHIRCPLSAAFVSSL